MTVIGKTIALDVESSEGIENKKARIKTMKEFLQISKASSSPVNN